MSERRHWNVDCIEAHKYHGAKHPDMFIRELFQSILDMPGKFVDVAMHDPLGALMLVFGSAFVALSVGYFTLLTLGSIADLFTPEPGGQPRQPGQ
jgi:hypothetical protein